jgi:hypothetical protein
MSKRVRKSLGSVISIAAVAMFLAVSFMASTAHATLRRPAPPGAAAAGTPDPSTYNVGYFDVHEPIGANGTGGGDNVVKLIQTTAAAPTPGPGNLCAMIYVYDDDEEQGECCGCLLTPNQLLDLSVAKDLTSNWEFTTPDNDNGVIKIVSAAPNNPGCAPHSVGGKPVTSCHDGCDPSIGYTQQPAIVGSILRVSSTLGTAGPLANLTETSMFEEGAPDTVEAGNLLQACLFNSVTNGSGFGACTCGPDNDL